MAGVAVTARMRRVARGTVVLLSMSLTFFVSPTPEDYPAVVTARSPDTVGAVLGALLVMLRVFDRTAAFDPQVRWR